MPFRQEILDHSAISHLGLLTTWDLFRAVRSMQKHSWPKDAVQPLFYGSGRIEIVPNHYDYLGKIAKAWTDKFGVVIEHGQVTVGDTIALEFPVEFEETVIGSIQVRDKDVNSAAVSDPAGFLWPGDRPKVREGIRVFRVNRPQSQKS
jgi:hypothetical protein